MRILIGFLGVLTVAGLMFFKASDAITIASASLGKSHVTYSVANETQPP